MEKPVVLPAPLLPEDLQACLEAQRRGLLGFFLAVLLTFASSHNSDSATLQVDLVRASEFTTLVYSRHVTNILNEAPWHEFDLESATTVSESPIENSIYNTFPPPWDDGVQRLDAKASAALLAVEALAASHGMDGSLSMAAALATVTFSPVVDASQAISLVFFRDSDSSAQFVRLVDLTLGQELWSYGWSGDGPAGWSSRSERLLPPGTLFQNSVTGWNVNLSATTDFLSTHAYTLTMYATTDSNPPDGGAYGQIQLSGLEFVPEPSSCALLGLGFITFGIFRRRC